MKRGTEIVTNATRALTQESSHTKRHGWDGNSNRMQRKGRTDNPEERRKQENEWMPVSRRYHSFRRCIHPVELLTDVRVDLLLVPPDAEAKKMKESDDSWRKTQGFHCVLSQALCTSRLSRAHVRSDLRTPVALRAMHWLPPW